MLSKLPVNDAFQTQLTQALQSMKIKPQELHCSQKVLEEYENLRETLMIYFSLDKYYNERFEEIQNSAEIKEDINIMSNVYKKAYDFKHWKMQYAEKERQQQVAAL